MKNYNQGISSWAINYITFGVLKLAASHIGLIGLGAMGSGIAACIARAGLSLSVYDSDEAKISAATSAPLIVKNTADTILKECDLILFCVPY